MSSLGSVRGYKDKGGAQREAKGDGSPLDALLERGFQYSVDTEISVGDTAELVIYRFLKMWFVPNFNHNQKYILRQFFDRFNPNVGENDLIPRDS